MAKSTIMLNRSEVMQLLDPNSLVTMLHAAFRAYSAESRNSGRRLPMELPSSGGAMVLGPGLTSEIPAYCVKVHAKFPQQNPAIRGLLMLHDLETGHLLSVMDSTFLTAVRTSLTAALATDLLARADGRRVAVVGAGVLGWYQLRYLLQMREVEEIAVFDLVKARSERFAELAEKRGNIKARACSALDEALEDADIVLAATWAREPFLFQGDVAAGTHITTLGPDQPGKCEVDAGLIKAGRFVCDDRELAVTMGAIGGAGLDDSYIHAEIGEVLNGDVTGRSDDEEITIYGAVGLPFQDLIAAWQVYTAARQKGLGRTFNFLA